VAYDRIAGRLAGGPVSFRFPTATGTFASRHLTSTDLENAAVNYLYSQFSRMLLQRALAAGARGDLVPLARLAYDSIGVDPETLVATADPAWSDAMYYAVECQDYAYYAGAGAPADRFAAWTAAGDARESARCAWGAPTTATCHASGGRPSPPAPRGRRRSRSRSTRSSS
jgi:hypothetical protein